MAERPVVPFDGPGSFGRRLAPRLAEGGWTVRVASRSGRIPTTPGPNGRVEAVAADLRDEDQGRRAASGAEAAVNPVGIGRERGQSFEAVHVEGRPACCTSRRSVSPRTRPPRPTGPRREAMSRSAPRSPRRRSSARALPTGLANTPGR